MRMRRTRNENVPEQIFCFGTFFVVGLGKASPWCGDYSKLRMSSSGDLRFLPLLHV